MKNQRKRFFAVLCVISITVGMTGNSFAGGFKARAASKARLGRTKITLREGEAYKVSIKRKPKKAKYIYKTSNNKVAKVGRNGKVTALKKGTAKVTVKQSLKGKKTKVGTLRVKVKGKKGTASPQRKPDQPPAVQSVTYQIVEKWNEAYNARVTIRNTSNTHIDDWAIFFYMEDEITNLWEGQVLKHEDGIYLVENDVWNQDIPVGGSVSFGFTANYEDKPTLPKSYCMSSHRAVADEKDYEVGFELYSDWGDGYNAGMTITNLTDEVIEDWSLEFDFDREIDNIWSTVITEKVGDHYNLKNPGWEQNVETNRPVIFGFTGYPGGVKEFPKNFVLKKYGNDIDYDLDRDDDGLTDAGEVIVGSNPYLLDTDGDGLKDSVEVLYLELDPTNSDTDSDDVADGDEDTDQDELTNLKEVEIGTEPWNLDTDYDDLSDGEEVNQYGTDPLNSDTDGDELLDGEDVLLGFDPNKPDTDDDGILDKDEKVGQSLEVEINEGEKPEITAVTVDMAVNGVVKNHTEIESVYGVDMLSSEVVGLVGAPVEIMTEGEFDQATITFHYDPSKLGETAVEDLAVMWYDEENEGYVIYDEESVLDTSKNTISYTTDHFSTYLVVDKKIWYNRWRKGVNYPRSSSGMRFLDMVFTIDASGSMRGTEIKHARLAITNFVDAMYESRDRGCVITFTDEAEVLKTFVGSKKTLKTIVEGIEAGGHTDTDKGLKKAIKQFTKDSYTSGNDRVVILVCDGDVEYNADIVKLANDNDVKIYTLMGGKYYFVDEAAKLVELMYKVQEDTLGSIDTNDSDGDGLYDVYETSGMLCANGKIMYSDPTKKDTDTDTLTDFLEMGGNGSLSNGKPYKYKRITIEDTGEEIVAYYFIRRSNPGKSDSDGDRMLDATDPKPNKKCSDKFVRWDTYDVVPFSDKIMSDSINSNIERNNAIRTVVRSKDEIEKLLKTKKKGRRQASIFGLSEAGKFIDHFLDGSGEEYELSESDVKKRMTDGPAVKPSLKNMTKLLRACMDMVKDGETEYIRTAPYAQFTFAEYGKNELTALTNPLNFVSFGTAEAGMIAECTNNGGEYDVTVKYFLLDYYDWDLDNDIKVGLVSASELHELNLAGLAQNFRIYGFAETSFTFNKDTMP